MITMRKVLSVDVQKIFCQTGKLILVSIKLILFSVSNMLTKRDTNTD